MGGRETFLPTALVVYACTRAARGYVENPPHPHLSPWSQTGDDLFNEGHYAWAKTTYSEALTAIQYGIFIGDELPRSECQCVPPPLSFALDSGEMRISHALCVVQRGRHHRFAARVAQDGLALDSEPQAQAGIMLLVRR